MTTLQSITLHYEGANEAAEVRGLLAAAGLDATLYCRHPLVVVDVKVLEDAPATTINRIHSAVLTVARQVSTGNSATNSAAPPATPAPVRKLSSGSDIKVGSLVKFSRQFLQSIGQYTGDMPQAVGKVIELAPLGGNILAAIHWDKPDMPRRTLACNLILQGQIEHG